MHILFPKDMRCILLLIFFAFSQMVYAQNVSTGLIDSLSNELNKTSSDTEKVNLLNELSYTYLSANVSVSAKYAAQALELAKKINWPPRLILCLKLLV